MMNVGRWFGMVSLLIGAMSFGAVAFRFEPSGAFANVFAGTGTGDSGAETEHAKLVVSRQTAAQIVAVFTISSFSSDGDGRVPRGTVRYSTDTSAIA